MNLFWSSPVQKKTKLFGMTFLLQPSGQPLQDSRHHALRSFLQNSERCKSGGWICSSHKKKWNWRTPTAERLRQRATQQADFVTRELQIAHSMPVYVGRLIVEFAAAEVDVYVATHTMRCVVGSITNYDMIDVGIQRWPRNWSAETGCVLVDTRVCDIQAAIARAIGLKSAHLVRVMAVHALQWKDQKPCGSIQVATLHGFVSLNELNQRCVSTLTPLPQEWIVC
jgi:hypothetical protein